jgi:hypothetical protein
MKYTPINLQEKLALFSGHFAPKIIAQMNDYHFKVSKFQGDFVWHNLTPVLEPRRKRGGRPLSACGEGLREEEQSAVLTRQRAADA